MLQSATMLASDLGRIQKLVDQCNDLPHAVGLANKTGLHSEPLGTWWLNVELFFHSLKGHRQVNELR
jgi:hypothetical protein